MKIPFKHYRLALGAALIAQVLLVQTQCLAQEEADPAEIALGERLFLETRFAQYFAAHGAGGDPVMDVTETTGAPLPGPFAGAAMNCAACHLVDQHLDRPGAGMRTYSDFARRSPVPAREDGKTHAVRNSPPLVNAALPRAGGLLAHFDGEFATLEDLVIATLSGRNYGWLTDETAQALRHIAAVIRSDDGSGELAQEFGGPYWQVFAGGPEVEEAFLLPPEYRIDVFAASDAQVVAAVARLISAYVADLVFLQDGTGLFNGSPYDRFLAVNGLPAQPAPGEEDEAYGARLLRAIDRLQAPIWVTQEHGEFAFHEQEFRFGPTELAGLKHFLRGAPENRRSPPGSSAGNCASCHAPPDFTDFHFHNTGVAQFEYDGLHGDGAFAQLPIPGLVERLIDHDRFLPATARHPRALEPFRAIASAEHPGQVDLGLWNIAFNPDFPKPQYRIWASLCRAERAQRTARGDSGLVARFSCRPSRLLERSIAAFKTPGLRDLGHSAPYLHNGAADTLEAVIERYRQASLLARERRLRNAAPELGDIRLASADVAPLAAFLRSLNEDYE